jgi:hypothetical protein
LKQGHGDGGQMRAVAVYLSDDQTREEVDTAQAPVVVRARLHDGAAAQRAAGARIEFVRNTARTGRPAARGMAAVSGMPHAKARA